MTTFELWYTTPKGASQGKFFATEEELIKAVKNFKRPATIKKDGEYCGRIWKDGNTWKWMYAGGAS
jgi:hypothetical protein